ncbi:hypothetical protein GCM10027082_14100 [Comamonas humi]
MPRRPHGKLSAAVVAHFKPDPEVAEGCEAEDYWEDPVEVWPENWDSLLLFISLQTQWNVAVGMGGGGRLGLRYEATYPLLDRVAEGDQAEWNRLFAEIRHMERAVLAIPVK